MSVSIVWQAVRRTGRSVAPLAGSGSRASMSAGVFQDLYEKFGAQGNGEVDMSWFEACQQLDQPSPARWSDCANPSNVLASLQAVRKALAKRVGAPQRKLVVRIKDPHTRRLRGVADAVTFLCEDGQAFVQPWAGRIVYRAADGTEVRAEPLRKGLVLNGRSVSCPSEHSLLTLWSRRHGASQSTPSTT